MSNDKMRAVWAAVKKNAKRELGILVVMVVFGVIVGAIAVPVLWVIAFWPDWALWMLFAACVAWVVFGETIQAGIRAYRGVKP